MNLDKIKKKRAIVKPKVRIRAKIVKSDVVVSTEIEKKPLKVNSEPLEIEIKEEVQKPEVAVEIEVKSPPEKKNEKSKRIKTTNIQRLDEKKQQALDIIRDIEEEAVTSLASFGKGRNASGNYSIEDKIRAILILRGATRRIEGKIDPSPNFTRVSRWLGVRAATLSLWWVNREDIIATSGGMAEEIERIAVFDSSLILIRTMDRLREKLEDNELSGKELISLFNVVVNKRFLLKGTPAKKRVDHYVHNLPVRTIAPASAEK